MKMAQKNAWNKYKKDEIKSWRACVRTTGNSLTMARQRENALKRSSDRQRITATEI